MRKRYIRLKELRSNLNQIYTPADEYLVTRHKLQKNEVYVVRTDEQGVQSSVWGYKSKKSIYLLGASTVESIYIRSSMRPHCILEKIILAEMFDCSVYNLGVSGAQTLNIINIILNKIGNKKDSTIVVSIPSNDATVLSLLDNYYSDHWRYASIVPATSKDSLRTKEIDYQPFKKNIEIIIELCKVLQLKLYMTSIIYTGENKVYAKLNEIARNICLSKNIDFIDFEPIFIGEDSHFYDDLHFLPSGSHHYAEYVFNAIKPTLTPSEKHKIDIHNIYMDISLNQQIMWSESIKVSNNSIVKIIIDVEFSTDAESKQAILAIDYGSNNIESEFLKSENKDIGFFKYLSGPIGKRVELITNIKVPKKCSAIRVGLRRWSSQLVSINRFSISVVNS